MNWFADNLAWMYWTTPSAIAIGGLVLVLVGMGVWDAYAPSLPRKGWLPMATTRGDRLFVGIMAVIGIHAVWLGTAGAVLLWIPIFVAVVVAMGVGLRG